MTWKQAELLQKKASDELDELNNPKYEYVALCKVECRFAPWTDEQLALENRVLKKEENQILIKGAVEKSCQLIRIDGKIYDISQRQHINHRYTVAVCKGYR